MKKRTKGVIFLVIISLVMVLFLSGCFPWRGCSCEDDFDCEEGWTCCGGNCCDHTSGYFCVDDQCIKGCNSDTDCGFCQYCSPDDFDEYPQPTVGVSPISFPYGVCKERCPSKCEVCDTDGETCIDKCPAGQRCDLTFGTCQAPCTCGSGPCCKEYAPGECYYALGGTPCGTQDCSANDYYYIFPANSPSSFSRCYDRQYRDCNLGCEVINSDNGIVSSCASTCACSVYDDVNQLQADHCELIAGCEADTPGAVDNYPAGTDCGSGKQCDGAGNCGFCISDADCPADAWFDTGSANQWVGTGECTEEEQKEQEFRDYYCDTQQGCLFTVTSTQWVATGGTRNKVDGTVCDDGLFCTENDQCSGGICDGSVKGCDDGVSCTDDSCDDVVDACVNTANDILCPTAGTCDGTSGNVWTGVCDINNDCVTELAPVEVCNGIDDDCDGNVDDGITCDCSEGENQDCPLQNGVCVGASQDCVGGSWTVCDYGVDYEVNEISCDGLDNDCDGNVDEEMGQSTCGVGTCEVTVDNCVAGVPQNCVPGTPVAESCDGLDNDCDGFVDEDLGQTTCGLGVCQHTVDNCVAGVSQTCDPMEGASVEVCDGLDNDCDGSTDEDLGQTTCGVGACEVTTDNCIGGVEQFCTPGLPTAEDCSNGIDDDCDGLTDLQDGDCPDLRITDVRYVPDPAQEDLDTTFTVSVSYTNAAGGMIDNEIAILYDDIFLGILDLQNLQANQINLVQEIQQLGFEGSNEFKLVVDPYNNLLETDELNNNYTFTLNLVCELGDCDNDGYDSFSDCNNEDFNINPDAEELCNEVDDDCDGLIDQADLDMFRPTCGWPGVCRDILETCSGSGLHCDPSISPDYEINEVSCDGLDNDCDLAVDEDLTQACPLSLGVCSGVVNECVSGSMTGCDYGVNYESVEVSCDGLDNDCDGSVDEGCECSSGETQQCGVSDVGECEYGSQTCDVNGIWSDCDGNIDPSVEVCDGLDNNCDGFIDEDLGQLTCGIGVCQRIVDYCINGVEQSCVPGIPLVEHCSNGDDDDCDGLTDENDDDCWDLSIFDIRYLPYPAQEDLETSISVYIDYTGTNVIDTEIDVYSSGVLIETVPVIGLQPNQHNRIDERYTFGFDGTHEFILVIDPLDNYAESDETNNDYSFALNLVCELGDCDNDGYDASEDCDNENNEINPGAEEICDGLDNDCNGLVDMDDPGLGRMYCGWAGVCGSSLQVCVGSGWTCDPYTATGYEGEEVSCDGLDNDCDFAIDEELTQACPLNEGVCSGVVNECVSGSMTGCDYGVYYEVIEASCDGLDNDCDGDTDENCICSSGEIQQCGVSDVGECEYGSQTCDVSGTWGTCFGNIDPSVEVCDGLDNDCDGNIDDGFGASSCGVGVCAHSVNNCEFGVSQTCDSMEGASGEVCDGLDNDCDGDVDEDNVCCQLLDAYWDRNSAKEGETAILYVEASLSCNDLNLSFDVIEKDLAFHDMTNFKIDNATIVDGNATQNWVVEWSDNLDIGESDVEYAFIASVSQLVSIESDILEVKKTVPPSGGRGGGGGSRDLAQCMDGIDNDNDGLVDTFDPGCEDRYDDTEFETVSAIACYPSWACGEWGPCVNGITNRECVDTTNCGILDNRPPVTDQCECEENWVCSAWGECVDDVQTRTCVDESGCLSGLNRPDEEKACAALERPAAGFDFGENYLVWVMVAVVVVGLLAYLIFVKFFSTFAKTRRFVKYYVKKGYSKAQIEDALKSRGWPADFIKKLLK